MKSKKPISKYSKSITQIKQILSFNHIIYGSTNLNYFRIIEEKDIVLCFILLNMILKMEKTTSPISSNHLDII